MPYTEARKIYTATWRAKHHSEYLAINRKHQMTFQVKKRAWRDITAEFRNILLN